MRLERQARERTGPPIGAVVGALIAVGCALTAVWLRLGLPRPICVLREWTGIPCPTCGTTRLLEALLSGDILGALAWNPLVFFFLAAVAMWTALSATRFALRLPTWRPVLSPRERLAAGVLAVAGLIGGWAWVVWRSL
jgi:hypothetical protein